MKQPSSRGASSQTHIDWAALARTLEFLNMTQISIGRNQTQGPSASLAHPTVVITLEKTGFPPPLFFLFRER